MLASAILLAGCAFDPAVVADRNAASYQADLEACRAEAAPVANKKAVATFKRFVTYPFSYPSLKREQTRLCLQKKGYTLAG